LIANKTLSPVDYSLSSVVLINIDLAIASKKANMRAYHILSTVKPLTNQSAIMIINAFTNNKKIPRVSIVIGKVRRTRIGFTIKLSTDNASATHTAVKNPSTSTPGRTKESKITNIAVSNRLSINFIVFVCVKIKHPLRSDS
jgi:hypothetical protein